MNKNSILLHLSLIPQIGPATVLRILQQKIPLASIYNYGTYDFIKRFGLSERIAQILVNGLKNKEDLETELELIKKYKISLLTIEDQEYPQQLKQIYLPPVVIYLKGAPLTTQIKLAVVGSRKSDRYAQQAIELILPKIISFGFEVVSGGALGVDTLAHKETVKNNGKTIVVFGAGLMVPYPQQNKELFRAIANGNGTIISPFSLKTQPAKGNFPARNRIISGLSDGCFVVQAARKSGALITAKFALEQGKPIFALPGTINNELSEGCHYLINEGARLVSSSSDILDEFGFSETNQKTFTEGI